MLNFFSLIEYLCLNEYKQEIEDVFFLTDFIAAMLMSLFIKTNTATAY